MDFNKRKRSRQENKSALLNWAVVILLAVAILNHLGKGRPVPEETPNELTTGTTTGTRSFGKLPDMQQLASAREKIWPDTAQTMLTTQDIEQGTGAPARCGQQVKVTYETFDSEEKPLPDSASAEKPLSFTVGEGKVLPALEQGVLGMLPQGLRFVFAPPAEAYAAKGFSKSGMPTKELVRFKLKLLEATPALPAPQSTSFRHMDRKHGAGIPTRCGSEAKVHFTVWDTEGKQLYHTRDEEKSPPVALKLGAGNQFIGLEQAVIGMKPGGERTVIVPPPFQKTLHEDPETIEIPFPKNQTVLVDIELLR